MICPSCISEFSKFQGLDLAKEQKTDGYICPDCGSTLRERALPKSFYQKMVTILVVGFVLTIPSDFLWQLNNYLGGINMLILVISCFSSIYFWALPKQIREQPFETVER